MSIKVKDTSHSTRAYTTNSHAKSDETKTTGHQQKVLLKKETLSCSTGEKSISTIPNDTAKESR